LLNGEEDTVAKTLNKNLVCQEISQTSYENCLVMSVSQPPYSTIPHTAQYEMIVLFELPSISLLDALQHVMRHSEASPLIRTHKLPLPGSVPAHNSPACWMLNG
jgi:hypothetical protein